MPITMAPPPWRPWDVDRCVSARLWRCDNSIFQKFQHRCVFFFFGHSSRSYVARVSARQVHNLTRSPSSLFTASGPQHQHRQQRRTPPATLPGCLEPTPNSRSMLDSSTSPCARVPPSEQRSPSIATYLYTDPAITTPAARSPRLPSRASYTRLSCGKRQHIRAGRHQSLRSASHSWGGDA